MIEIGAIASDTTNLQAGASASAIGVSDHSFSQFPVQKTGDDTPTMSFDDFLDMINPLEHIPVVSSIYRAVSGNTINPVSRIAGDALYGGVFGLASAGISALGAIADEAFASLNDGKSASTTVMAAFFGTGDQNQTQVTQLAEAAPAADTPAPLTTVALLQTPANQSPILAEPDFSHTPPALAQTSAIQVAQTNAMNAQSSLPSQPVALAQANAMALASTTPSATAAFGVGPGLPIDRSKPAYGGVMDTAMVQTAQQNQALALALAGGRNTMQSQHDIRNSRFATSNNAASSTAGGSNEPATVVSSMPTLQAAGVQNQISALSTPPSSSSMQSLIQNLQAMKGLNKYRSTAQSMPAIGSSLDVTN
jgi:hypothetical protein